MSGNFGRTLGRVLRQILQQVLRNYTGNTQTRTRTRPTPTRRATQRGKRVDFPFGAGTTPTGPMDPATTQAPSAHAAREYRMPPTGLPQLSYAPRPDGQADPGEVAWAWVPYEDDPNQGKDRPVLVVSEVTGGFLALQMTSRDHSRDRAREASFGRHWLNIGTGAWDSQGRESEVRLDRLLFIPHDGIRREGATLPKDRFLEVAEALHALHR